MASLDFEREKKDFRKFYESNRKHFNDAKNAYIRIISSLIMQSDVGEVTKIEGRIKDKEECVKKFHRKYQSKLEADEQPPGRGTGCGGGLLWRRPHAGGPGRRVDSSPTSPTWR